MKLFHGSIVKVSNPEIREATHTLDYGKGFYATTSYEQAEDWVKRKMDEHKAVIGYVNVYEFNESALKGFNSLIFKEPTEEWVDFVMQNRTIIGFQHNFDIVYGPVANDKVYAAFALYEGGVLDKLDLIKELKTYKLVDQYLFHTDMALQSLTFIEAKEITL